MKKISVYTAERKKRTNIASEIAHYIDLYVKKKVIVIEIISCKCNKEGTNKFCATRKLAYRGYNRGIYISRELLADARKTK